MNRTLPPRTRMMSRGSAWMGAASGKSSINGGRAGDTRREVSRRMRRRGACWVMCMALKLAQPGLGWFGVRSGPRCDRDHYRRPPLLLLSPPGVAQGRLANLHHMFMSIHTTRRCQSSPPAEPPTVSRPRRSSCLPSCFLGVSCSRRHGPTAPMCRWNGALPDPGTGRRQPPCHHLPPGRPGRASSGHPGLHPVHQRCVPWQGPLLRQPGIRLCDR